MCKRVTSAGPGRLSAALCALLLFGGCPRAEVLDLSRDVDAADVPRIYGSEAEQLSPEAAQAMLLDLVNAARAGGRLARLAESEAARRLAQAHADEMASQHYLNHYDLLGRKCEMRFNVLGETDNVSENVTMLVINAKVFLTPKLVQLLHDAWMDSSTHSETLLRPQHSHLGCAFAIDYFTDKAGNQVSVVAAVEEFVDDYGDCARLPETVRPGEVLQLSGRLDTARAHFAYIGLGSEYLPFERTPEYQMEHISGYSPPEPGMAILALEDGPGAKGVLRGQIKYTRQDAHYDSASGTYSAEVPIAPHWPHGAYYISVWATDPAGSGKPFCVMTQVVLVK